MAALLYAAALRAQVAPGGVPAIPPGITPGGASPETEFRTPVPRPTPELLPIPPAVQRPLGVEEGGRLFVKKFDLVGVVDRPEQGIRAEQVAEFVEGLRRATQQLTGEGPDGFTPPERERLLKFMREAITSPDAEVEAYRALVEELRAAQRERRKGLTIGQLQEIANEVTRYYRKAGFILAQAFIPAQEVKDGIVKIEVVEGALGQVIAQDNERYSSELLARPFKKLIDAPVIGKQVETALSLLSDYPGLSAYGVFRPGKLPGTTDLVLNVEREKRVDGAVRFDNYGTRFTGQERLSLDLGLNNPLTRADRLEVNLIQSYDPKESIYGLAQYQVPVYDERNVVGLGYSRNAYDVGGSLGELEIGGLSEIANVFLRRTFLRGRQRNLFASIGLARKLAKTESRGRVVTRDQLAVLGLEASYDSIDVPSASIQAGTLHWDHGFDGVLGGMDSDEVQTQRAPPSRRTPDGEFVGGGFNKVSLSYARLKNLSGHQSLLFRFNGQYTPDPLVSIEQFVLGGPNSVRAYPRSEYLFDSGFFASLEWTINASQFTDRPFAGGRTWGEVLSFLFFVDYAAGWQNDPLRNEMDHVSLSGVGLGLQWNLPQDLSAKFQVAHRTSSVEPSDGEDTRFWFDLQYTF
jgi:hemolysin activation/secretion protein